MENVFLKAKHWQLFTLTFILPLVFYFVSMFLAFYKIKNGEVHGEAEIFSFMGGFVKVLFLVVFSLTCFISMWFYYVSKGMYEKIEHQPSYNLKRFSVVLFVPLLILCMIFTIFFMSYNSITNFDELFAPSTFVLIWLALMLLNFISLFSTLHSIFYTAKTIKTVELGREVRLTDFLGEFFLIMFFPIGVWYIQPKINEYVMKNKS